MGSRLILTLVLGLALNLLRGHPADAASQVQQRGPIRRAIVPDLTSVLAQQLQSANISLLLVLPGQQPQGSMKLDFARLASKVERLEFIHNYEAFLAQWHGFYRYHRWKQLQLPSTTGNARLPKQQRQHQQRQQQQSQPAGQQQQQQEKLLAEADADPHHQLTIIDSAQPAPYDSRHPLHAPQPPRVALLLRGQNGAVRAGQSNLAAGITRRLRHSHSLSLAYSSHADKGDSLLSFAFDGEPLQANFLATSVFKDAFNAIYEQKKWGTGGGGSGDGSNLAYTEHIRAVLPDVIARYNISSMLDSSCGSMFWMPMALKTVEESRKSFRFMGTDVVCSLISRHQKTFAEHTNWQFQCVDYSNQPLPKGYELVWSRDSLQHVPMHGAWQFLNNVKASGAKYLLVGSYIKYGGPNEDIKAGEYYPIDLLKPPFSLSKPLEIIDEGTPDGKHLLLFEVDKMTWTDELQGLV